MHSRMNHQNSLSKNASYIDRACGIRGSLIRLLQSFTDKLIAMYQNYHLMFRLIICHFMLVVVFLGYNQY